MTKAVVAARCLVWNAVGLAAVSCIYLSACGTASRTLSPEISDLIQQAGDDEDDNRRVELLKRLRGAADSDAALSADVDRLVTVSEEWVTSKTLAYFHDEGRKPGFDLGIDKRSALFPLSCLYRGRMLFALGSDARRMQAALADLRRAADAFPRNRVARMYLGQPIAWEKALPGTEAAPEWAALERENLERLADIVEWWIDQRRQEDGEFGGDWEDDCEMWRWWVPVLIAFCDRKIVQAQERFSNAVMNLPRMRAGSLFRWPSALSAMCNTLLVTYDVTGDEKYLAPLRSMAAIRLQCSGGRTGNRTPSARRPSAQKAWEC